MLSASVRARPPRRLSATIVTLTVLIAGFGATSASADPVRTADPGLSAGRVDFSGTGGLVTNVRTEQLRAAVPQASPEILIVGTGVERSLFPASLQPQILSSGSDPHGYGTLAASVILQLIPDARITVSRVRAHDPTYHLMRMDDLRDALAGARGYDAVLLAFPPQAALDPIAHLAGHHSYGRFGTGLTLIVDALLTTRSGINGIPADAGLREQVLSGMNLRQRDAVEAYVKQARLWNRVVEQLDALDAAGIPVVAPAGDFTIKEGDRVVDLPTQTVFGLSARESVITVGATYLEGSAQVVSPTSGRGPTLGLEPKPDLVAPSDVMGMLPASAQLAWPDDSLRAPLQTIRWAKGGTPPSTCPSVQGTYRCVLQGSSMVSASVVAANVAAAIAGGLGGDAQTDEVARGLAWAIAGRTDARAYRGGPASTFAQGAGVFGGLRGIDASSLPIALRGVHLGEASWAKDASISVPLWRGGAPAVGSGTVTSVLGPDTSGAAVELPFDDPRRVRVSSDGYAIEVRAVAGRYQGGLYTGVLSLEPPAGDRATLPVTFTQTLPLDFKASYAFNELMGDGEEGERVEDATLLLFAGLPTNVGLIGTAFKNLSGKAFRNLGGDPTNNYMLRMGRTANSFRDAVPASEHGIGRIPNVAPGFYRMHLLVDHSFEARQERGRPESIGIGLGTFGPEAAFIPGANVLMAAQPPCDGGAIAGPFDGCLTRDGGADPTTGFCSASNASTRVTFNVYCAPASYAVPSAVASRGVHLIEHDAIPTRSEWAMCGVDVPSGGSSVTFDALAAEARACENGFGGPSWSFDAGALGCLGPTERGAFPNGHPADVTASYSSAAAAGLPGRSLPVAVMSYEVRLPRPNTYTTASLSLSYVAEDAIVGVRWQTGEDGLIDASNSVLVIDDPDVTVSPALERAATAGSAYHEWGVMSANATRGILSIIVIPTAWVNTGLGVTRPIASVQLCDVALRVNTFAKASYGMPAGGVQSFSIDPNGAAEQIRGGVSRVRPVHDGTRFGEAGVERESLTVAVHIPKNTTREASARRHVSSPVGGPAYLASQAGAPTTDPEIGTRWLECSRNPDLADLDVDRNRNAAVCTAWEQARASGDIVAELTPEAAANGRFFGVLPLDRAAVAGGPITVKVRDADDGGAFDARWESARRFTVSDFYDDAVPFQLTPLSGVIKIARGGDGNPQLQVASVGAGGATHLITSMLE